MEENNQNLIVNQNSPVNSEGSDRDLISRIKKIPLTILGAGFLVVLAILLTTVFLLNRPSDEVRSGDIAQLSKDAQDAYKAGDYGTVEKKMSDALETLPGDPRAQATLIKAIANQGNLTATQRDSFNKAVPYIEDALVTNPNDKEVLLAVGYAYETSGQFEEALGFYERALGVNPKDPQALFHKGHVLEFLDRQEEAFQIYTEAYKVSQTHPQIAMAYAKVQLLSGNPEGAEKIYVNVSNLADAEANLKAEALTNAAIISRVDLQDFTSSLEHTTKAVALANNFSPALAEHGFNLAMNNQLSEGIEYMQKAIKANPRIAQNYWRIGGLYRLSGDYESALTYQDEALAKIASDNTILNGNNKKIIKAAIEYDLATTNLRLGNNDKVLPLLSQAVADNPELKIQLKIDFEEYKVFESLNQDEAIINLTL